MTPENGQEQPQLPKVEGQNELQSEISEKNTKNVDKPMNDQELTDNLKGQNYEQDAKKLINFIKNRPNSSNNDYHFEGIWQLKEQDYGKKISDFKEIQISSLIDDYNQANPQRIIEKGPFISTFREKKEKIIIKSESTPSTVLKDTIQENQQVSKFILSPEQSQKIKNSFSNIINKNYEISRIKLIGKASGDVVTDTGKTLAKESITKFLLDLQTKGFDISQLPTHDAIKDQPWFNKEQEDKNPGNYAWAYGRALMQLTALSTDELKSLSRSKIDFDINPNDVKGDEFTGGGIDFYGQASAKTSSLSINAKNEIANQWTDLDFFIRTVDEKGKDTYINKYFKKDIKYNKETKQADINIVESFEQQDYQFTGTKGNSKGYIENYMIPKKGEAGKVKLSGDVVYISLSPEKTQEYKNILSKGKNLSVQDLTSLYQDISQENNPQIEKRKNNYLAYEKLQNEINENTQERKLN